MFFCCRVMAADSWNPFQGCAGEQHAYNSTELISCARASENKQEQFWGIHNRLGKEMEKNQRSRTGSNWDLSRTLLSRSWRDLNCKWHLAKQEKRGQKQSRMQWKHEDVQLQLSRNQMSWSWIPEVLLSMSCAICSNYRAAVQPALLIWNRRSPNLSVSGNGYLT